MTRQPRKNARSDAEAQQSTDVPNETVDAGGRSDVVNVQAADENGDDGHQSDEKVVSVPLESIRMGLSPRTLDEPHVERLAATLDMLPPVVVHRDTMLLVDGLHRYTATRRAGRDCIDAVMFDGSEREARIEAVRANTVHGLPMSTSDRKQAAVDIFRDSPDLSNGYVAKICGLDPKTVGPLRPTREFPELEKRLGRDGKTRVTHPRLPQGPRSAAELTGADSHNGDRHTDPTRGQHQSRPSLPRASAADANGLGASDNELGQPWYENDDAMLSACPELVAFLTRTAVNGDLTLLDLATVPANRRYQLIDEASNRAKWWGDFAQRIGGQLRAPR
jgi:hypothetical protein